MTSGPTCDCGQPKPVTALQCSACNKAAFKRIAKYSVLAGMILGLVCSSIPPEYQAVCKAVATTLSAC